MAQHALGRPTAQRLDVLDAVAARDQRMDQGEQLAAGSRRARTVPEVPELVANPFNPQPFGQRGGQQQPGVRDRAFDIERDIYAIENDVRGSH